MPFAPSSFLLLVVRPGAPSSVPVLRERFVEPFLATFDGRLSHCTTLGFPRQQFQQCSCHG